MQGRQNPEFLIGIGIGYTTMMSAAWPVALRSVMWPPPYLFGLFLGDPSYYVYTPKHFGSRVDILIGLQLFFLACIFRAHV